MGRAMWQGSEGGLWLTAREELSPANNLTSKLGSRPTSIKRTGETGVPDDPDCNILRSLEVPRRSNR